MTGTVILPYVNRSFVQKVRPHQILVSVIVYIICKK
jgi:hypothetical protein